MNFRSRISDFFIVLIFVGVVVGVSHFVTINPLGPSRLLYYVEAPIIQWKMQCSDGAPEWMARVQRYATRNMGAPASQLAYISSDNEIYHCETGWKDGVFGKKPMDEYARFRFASVTKTITAIATLDLVNKNRLSLDDKLVRLIELEQPLKDPRVGDITVRDLLSHRAGWDRERTQDVMFMRGVTPWCPYYKEKLSETTLMYTPGEIRAYSNLGYCLLGVVIEKVVGKPFREYVSELFGFDNTTVKFIDGPYLSDEVAYDFRHENLYGKSYFKWFDFYALSSSAGLSGSALDLAKLVKKFLGVRGLTILDGDMVGACDPSKVQECYGYGVYRYQPSKVTTPLYIHSGKLPGATSEIIVFPDGAVIAWLGAGTPGSGIGAAHSFFDYIRESRPGASPSL